MFSVITALWMVAAGVVAIGAVYFIVWLHNRRSWEYLAFSTLAASTLGIAITEIWMLTSTDIEEIGNAQQWFHLPIFTAIVSMVGFIHFRLGAARVWVGVLSIAIRSIALIINAFSDISINYSEITEIAQIEFFGTSISTIKGVPNPWQLIANGSLVLLVIYMLDATISSWRQSQDSMKVWTGAALCLMVTAASTQAILVFWGFLHMPVLITPVFVAVAVIQALELGHGLSRAEVLNEALQNANIEIQQNEERLSLAAEAADAGLWSLDERTGHVWATPKAEKIFAAEKNGQLSWENILSSVHEIDRNRLTGMVDEARSAQKILKTELRVNLPDDAVRWISVLANWHTDEERGKILTGVVIDITNQKELDEQAAQQAAQISHLSRVATVSELSSSLAHELNQPLGIILSNAEAAAKLLENQSPDLNEIREILDDIAAADRRAANVITRLRSMLKEGQLTLVDVSVNNVIRGALTLIQSEFLLQDMSINLDLDENEPEIRADQTLLTQVILNLLTNASEAVAQIPANEREIHVSSRANGSTVDLFFRDSGGSLPDDPEEVFKPFFTTKASGLGMGLAIVRSIVKSHGGTILASTDNDGFSRFSLSFPVKEAV